MDHVCDRAAIAIKTMQEESPMKSKQLLSRWPRLGLLLFSLLFSSCVFKKLLFEHLDQVLLYQVDSYLDLDSSQKKSLEGPLSEGIAWIKKEKLAEAIDLILLLEKAAAEKDVDRRALEAVADRLKEWRIALAERFASPVAELLKSLDLKQIAHFEKKLKKGLEPLEKLLGTDPADFAEELEDYTDEQVKKFKPWFGPLRPEQRALVIRAMQLDRQHLTAEYARRQAAREDLLRAIATKSRTELTGYVKGWIAGDPSWGDAAHRSYVKAYEERWSAFWLDFYRSLSPKQWAQLQQKLEETRRDLETMRAKPA